MRIKQLIVSLLSTVILCNCSPEEEARPWQGTRDDETQLDVTETDPDPEQETGKTQTPQDTDVGNLSPAGCKSMDILFVIDDSASMFEEQENLKANFPKFIEVLDDYRSADGNTLDYRVGVTTIGVVRSFRFSGVTRTTEDLNTTVDDGVLLGSATGGEPFCGLNQPWLTGPGSDVVNTFNCMATLGTDGTVVEMPFAVIEKALGERSAPGGVNEGFYRKDSDSLLVVVIITDEDDCSIEEGGKLFVSAMGSSDCNEKKSTGLYAALDTKTFLDNLTGGEGRYVLVSIAALTPCESDFGKADPAPRLKALSDAVGEHAVFGDICQGDLWLNLKDGLELIQSSCRAMPDVI